MQDLFTALANLLTPYYEPIECTLFSTMYALESGTWWIYKVILDLRLLELQQGVRYFKGRNGTTPRFQTDFDSFMNNLDTFVGNVEDIISDMQRFSSAGSDVYSAKRIASLHTVTSVKPLLHFCVWKASEVIKDTPSCSNLTVLYTQTCND